MHIVTYYYVGERERGGGGGREREGRGERQRGREDRGKGTIIRKIIILTFDFCFHIYSIISMSL